MNSNSPHIVPGPRPLRLRATRVAIAIGLLTSGHLVAQPVSPSAVTPQQLARYDQNKNGVLDAAELAAMHAAEKKADSSVSTDDGERRSDIVTLNPFEVSTDKDDGFAGIDAGTATKLGLDLKDMAAPYSVMTGEFIKAMGITDLQEAVMWSTNGTPVLDAQGADLFGGGNTVSPSVMYNVRGFVVNTGQQRNFFLTAGITDTYNIERIDFGRGPNAVLFNVGANEALGGGISTVGKRARFDRDSTTVELKAGSFDYYRGALDVNQVITDRIAVRGNAVVQKKKGYMDGQFENRRGLTLSGTYRLGPKTEFRVETIWDKTERSNVALPLFDNLSGWDGSTTFSGPITNNMINGVSPLTTGTTLTTAVGGQGNAEGVWREGGNVYFYDPSTNSVMNWIHTGSTRRGDENPGVPIYIDGQMWTRNNNGNLLPFGNNGGSSGVSRTPGATENGGNPSFIYQPDLPSNRYSRQVANSHFVIPGKRSTVTPDEPLFIERLKDINVGFTHKFSDTLILDFSADANRVDQRSIASNLGFRNGFIDINRTLPNGTPNPHFLDPYSHSDITVNYRRLDNYGARANLGYIKDLGKWGHYTLSLVAGTNGRDVEYRRFTMSLASLADPREWHAGAQQIRARYYWNDSARPFSNVAPVTLFNRVPSADGNSYTTSTTTVAPRWVISDWSDKKERTYSGIFAFAARYFDNRLVLSPGVRVDKQHNGARFRPTSWGFLPNNPSWDGVTLDDRYWRPDAPTDWLKLSYIPKNADGTPRSTVAIPAFGGRPTAGGVNDVNPAAPQYASDRFRGDYNNPDTKPTIINFNVGLTYHVLPWMSAKLNYGDSYKPADTGRLLLTGEEADPESGVAYEAGLTFSFFKGNLTLTPRYYFNQIEGRTGGPSTTGPINDLLARNAWNDPSPEGRNPFGYLNVLGDDYLKVKNDGVELELVGRISRGWRVMGNFGTGQRTDYDRFKSTQAYVLGRQQELLDTLVAAGGRLDTSGAFNNLKSKSAPGWAIADPAIPDSALLSPTNERRDAVTNYNNIWTQYDNITALQDTLGIKRMKINFFTDYTVQQGRFKGLRLGIGYQYVDKDVAGYRSGDTIPNPNFNPALPVSATNLTYADDPTVDANTPIWIKRPADTYINIGYSKRLSSRFEVLNGREVTFQLNIKNVLNQKAIYYQDDSVRPRAPGGNLAAPARVSQPSHIAKFQVPINFEFTTTIKL